jgi:hypothetical protein
MDVNDGGLGVLDRSSPIQATQARLAIGWVGLKTFWDSYSRDYQIIAVPLG